MSTTMSIQLLNGHNPRVRLENKFTGLSASGRQSGKHGNIWCRFSFFRAAEPDTAGR